MYASHAGRWRLLVMTETDFTTDWLSERFHFDSKARNKEVQQSCFQYLQHKSHLSIVDIGAGHGSNFFYLSPKLRQDQSWYFIELNAELLDAALMRIVSFAEKSKYTYQKTDYTVSIQAAGKKIQVTGICASFLQLPKIVSLQTVDLVTAGAVFDLLSENLFAEVVLPLIKAKVPLLATINYKGMAFAPEQEQDAHFLHLYHQHMWRQQAFGRSMGPECLAYMTSFFLNHKVAVLTGSSDWQVGPTDKKMHHFLLSYLEAAIGEMINSTQEKQDFEKWLTHKKEQLHQAQLTTKVFHQDLFAYFE